MMVGELASHFYGFSRATDDLDLCLEDTLQNRKSFRKAFIELGYGDYESLETMQFIPSWTSFYATGVELDIMTSMKGLEAFSFTDCYNISFMAKPDDIMIPYLHINHLIENKKAVNRPKDQVDVIQLEKIRSLQINKQDKTAISYKSPQSRS